MSIDFVRLLQNTGIPFDTTVNRGWVNVRCPVCDDHSNHGGFNIVGGYYHCWKCGSHNVKYVLRQLTGLNADQVDELFGLYEGRSIVLNNLNKTNKKPKSIELPGRPLPPIARKYLKSRRFDPDFIVEKYGVKYGGIAGTWRNRLLIPIVLDKRLISYQGRAISDIKPRYLTLSVEKSVIDPKSVLYNVDNCPGDTLNLLEGVTDVWRLGDGFAASFGTSISPAQIRFISKRFQRVRVLFDPEREARAKAAKMAALLASFDIETEIIDLELDHDPGDCSDKEVQQIRTFFGL